MSTVVVGGGIAGFSIASALAERGDTVTLVEREALPFSHSSARNAAIFRPLEESPIITELASRSRALMYQLHPNLLNPAGVILCAASSAALRGLMTTATLSGVTVRALAGAELLRRAPLLAGSRCEDALWLPDGGIIDIHALAQALRRRAVALGTRVLLSQEVVGIDTSGDGVCGVRVASGACHPATRVILAGGAWASDLGALAGCRLDLIPHRRHLSQLDASPPLAGTHPVCWDTETGVYFRPESQGFLACPGDHQPHPASSPLVDPDQLTQLARKLPALAPALEQTAVRRTWACLRTMSADAHMALGEDPRLLGLFWFAGLAGHGMTTALGAAELLADNMLLSKPIPLGLEAGRLLPEPGRAVETTLASASDGGANP